MIVCHCINHDTLKYTLYNIHCIYQHHVVHFHAALLALRLCIIVYKTFNCQGVQLKTKENHIKIWSCAKVNTMLVRKLMFQHVYLICSIHAYIDIFKLCEMYMYVYWIITRLNSIHNRKEFRFQLMNMFQYIYMLVIASTNLICDKCNFRLSIIKNISTANDRMIPISVI